MCPSFLGAQPPYFFSQRRNKRLQRRPRKILDDVSLFGEKRDPFIRADGESVVSAGWLSKPTDFSRTKSALRRGSATSGKRVVLSSKVVVLPSVDIRGPRLVSGEVEAKSLSGVSKHKVAASHPDEEEPRSGWTKVKEVYKFDELKFGSTSILSSLAKLFDSAPLREHDSSTALSENLDPELLSKFLQNYHSLTSDTVVEKREWQTDCYLDVRVKNEHSFLTAPPEEEKEEGDCSEERKKLEETISAISKRYAEKDPGAVCSNVNREQKEKEKGKEKRSLKRVTLNQGNMSKDEFGRRPQTARSTLSNYSFHSDYSRPSSAGESRINDFDMLPAELRPSIMLYKRESMAPKVKVKGPRTRLEKFRSQMTQDRHSQLSRNRLKKSRKPDYEPQDVTPKTTGHRPSTAHAPSATHSQVMRLDRSTAPPINFSLADSDTRDKGWLVYASEAQDPESATLHMWDERRRKLEEEKMIAKQKNADGPLVVKFYSDPQTRSLRSKHQRSATFPLPAVLTKLPPSVANFTTPGVASGDVMMIGAGPELAVLIHPDGSGHANYHSKHGQRQAVCQCRTDLDTQGLITVVYDDTEAHHILACFTPLGKGWCYYPGSGGLHMLYDLTELRLYDEDGHVIRRTPWISDKVSVSLQLNPSLSFHCTSMTNMVLRFSCRGQTYKFNVSPPASPLAHQSLGKTTDCSVTLQSGLEFISDAALAHKRTVSPPPALKPAPKTKKALKRNRSLSERSVGRSGSVAEEEDLGGRQTASTDLNTLTKNLTDYRNRIKNTVDEWMVHYRQTMGISLPAHLRTSFSRSPSPLQGHHGSTRQLYSSRSYAGEGARSRPTSQAHFYTHPLPSRVTSPFGGQSSSRSPNDGMEREIQVAEYMTTPPPATPLPTTPIPAMTFDHITAPESEGRYRGHKSERRKIRRKSSIPNKRYGCPVSLHNLLLNSLDTMSPCKCDKRRPPYICDLEYDVFLRSHVPSTQVAVVCVLSTVVEGSCPYEPMLDALHSDLNKQRFSPCTQSSEDEYRVLKYDLGHSLSGTKRTTPLLVERHAAWPGMFLMYVGGHLVHADCVFNGYGTTKRDFLKQVERCLLDASKGRYLPSDYHFSPSTGGKHPPSTSWAYPLTGVLDFLVPYSPSSPLSSTSTPPHCTPSDNEDDDIIPPQFGRRSTQRSGLDLSHLEAIAQLSKSSRHSATPRDY